MDVIVFRSMDNGKIGGIDFLTDSHQAIFKISLPALENRGTESFFVDGDVIHKKATHILIPKQVQGKMGGVLKSV